MTFPSGATTITVSINRPTPAGGAGNSGRIIFTPSTVLVDATHHAIYSGSGAATLDTNGVASIVLLTTDAPGVLPTGWRWQVDEQLPGARRTYYIDLPSTLGSTIDLSQLSPVSTPGGSGQSLPPTGPAGGALTGAYPNPTLASATLALFDAAGTASAAQAAAISAAATDATAKVTAHAAASDPHADRAYADNKFATQLNLTALGGTVNSLSTDVTNLDGFVSDCLARVQNIETGNAYLNGGHYVGPVDISGAGLTIVDGNLILDSTGTAINAVDRGATSNFAAYVLRTAGADRWAWQLVNDGTNDLLLTDSANGVPVLRVIPGATPALTFTSAVVVDDANFSVLGTGKGYRFRPLGSRLDCEATGSDWMFSVFSGTNFDGTQRTYLRMESGVQLAHACGTWIFTDTADSAAVHTLDGSGNKLGFHGATPVAKQTINGSRASGAALADLLTKLANVGLFTDGTTA